MMKEGRKREYHEKTPDDEIQKMAHTKARAWNWLKEKKKEKKRGPFQGLGGMLSRKILKVEIKICGIRGILEANLKKYSTLKFIMNISFVPSTCIHRSIILIFIGKSILVDFFPQKIFFPWFSIFISARILISATNSRRCKEWKFKPQARLEPAL